MNIEQEAASLYLILPFCLPSFFMYSCPQIEVDPSFLKRTAPKFYFGILDSIRSRSHSVVSYSLQPQGLYSPWNSPGKNTGVDSHSLLQGTFLTHRSNPDLSHRRQILYYLSQQGSSKNTGVGSFSLLQGIFPTQGLNPGLPHCRQILYQLSHKGSPRIL